MCSCAFYAIAVVDATLSSFSVYIEVLQIVVEIDGASTKVATQEGGVGSEDGCNVYPALLAQRECDTGKPLMKLDNDGALLLVEDVLD